MPLQIPGMAQLRQYLSRRVYQRKRKRESLGYKNYQALQIMAYASIVAVLVGLLIGSLK